MNYVQRLLNLPLLKVSECLHFLPGVTRDIFIDQYQSLPPHEWGCCVLWELARDS